MFVKKWLGITAATLTLALTPTVYAADDEVLEQGKALFTSDAKPMACALCHALKDAGAAGSIGPNLDDIQPTREQMKKVMIEGMGAMPSFEATLSEQERDAIVEYVHSALN